MNAVARPNPARAWRGAFSGWSLHRTLLVSILTLFALVTALSGLAMSLTYQRGLEAELDMRVMSAAARFGGAAEGHPRRRDDDRPGGPLVGPDTLLLVRRDGATVTNVVPRASHETTSLNSAQVTAVLSGGLSAEPHTVDLGDDVGVYRVVGFTRPDGDEVVVGQPAGPMLEAIRQMRVAALLVGLVGFVALGLGTAWVVRRALRPLERVAATAARVSRLPLSDGDVGVGERVPAEDTDDRTEVGQVGAALNDLLAHVDTSLRVRRESERQLRRFVADASHELRTPLASIRGYTELSLRDPDLPQEVRHSLGRVESESGRMATLVDDLLLLARLDAGRPLNRAPVDLTLLLMDTVNDARVAGADHRWMLDLPDEAIEITGDQARLTQVLVNLLANARLHTPPGTTVTSSVHQTPSGVVVAVEDDGPGIDPDLLPTIFRRFARGDASRNRNQGSTGLGLSIADAVVSAHGGSITVESRPGRTRFEITLPDDERS